MNYKNISKLNRKKTKIVLLIYLVIYVFIGLLIDVVMLNSYDLSLFQALEVLATFQVFPMATFVMLVVGAISIWVSILSFHRILLSGNEYVEIKLDTRDRVQKQVYNIVEELKISARLEYMPKVYLIDAPYMNAFASGWNEKTSLVAISTGLIEKLNREEIQAVLAHEITHIRNEDVKLTLVVGVVANVMLFTVNYLVYFFMGGKNSKSAQNAKIILLVFQFILPIITVILQMYLSRSREYMADSGAVELTRNSSAMANALKKISGDYDMYDYRELDKNPTRKSAYIFQKGDSIFSTHPSIENRVKAILGKK